MIKISAGVEVVTFINVFTVAADNQARLAALLTAATEGPVRDAKGFISASLHCSTDGTKVVMYSQWRSLADYEAMRKDPTPLPYLREALGFATFESNAYSVVKTFEGTQ